MEFIVRIEDCPEEKATKVTLCTTVMGTPYAKAMLVRNPDDIAKVARLTAKLIATEYYKSL
jgi:hypothetical protein